MYLTCTGGTIKCTKLASSKKNANIFESVFENFSKQEKEKKKKKIRIGGGEEE
jgi:hypothetical protein